MKITVEHVLTGENEILVKCQQLDFRDARNSCLSQKVD